MINYDRSKKSSLRKRDSNLIGTKPSSLKSYLTKNTRINSVHVRIEKNMGKKPKNIKKIKKTDWLIFPVCAIMSCGLFFVFDYPLNYIYGIGGSIPLLTIGYLTIINHIKNNKIKHEVKSHK